MDGRERGLAIGDVDDLVAVRGEQLPIERADAVGVVGDEHAAAARRLGTVRRISITRNILSIGSTRPRRRRATSSASR